MIRFILLSSFLVFIYVDYLYSEESTIHLVPNNPNTEIIITNDINPFNAENGINVIIINEDEEITIFNNNDSNTKIGSSDLNLNEETTNNLERLSVVWKNSNEKNINFLFEKLNYNLSSNIIKSNLTNSLIYGTFPPQEMSQSEFDKLRISNLKSLGNVEAAIAVIGNISTYDSNKDLYDKIVLEKSLNDYNLAAVCGVLNSDSKFKVDVNLLKIKIFCSFLNNRTEEADFFNSLLLEENNDEYFQALYNMLINEDSPLKDIQDYNYDNDSISLYSAIMRSLNIPFTYDFIHLNSPELLKAIAISPVTEISVRLEAAQKAFYFNSLDAESIAALYQSVNFSKEDLDNPLITIKNKFSNNPQKSMALLFQSSRIQILPISRLEALSNFWSYANSVGQSGLAYELSKDLLKSIESTSELIDFAVQTSKAHLHNDSIDESKKWLKLIQAKINIEQENEINKDYLQLIFLMNIKEGKYKIDESMSNRLFNSLDIENEDINNLELYLTTLDFIGFDVPLVLWEITAKKVKDDRTVPSMYIMKLLEESSGNNQLGELFLSIAVSMEDNNWSEIHPQHVNTIFESLEGIGEDQIIKDLALEILENAG